MARCRNSVITFSCLSNYLYSIFSSFQVICFLITLGTAHLILYWICKTGWLGRGKQWGTTLDMEAIVVGMERWWKRLPLLIKVGWLLIYQLKAELYKMNLWDFSLKMTRNLLWVNLFRSHWLTRSRLGINTLAFPEMLFIWACNAISLLELLPILLERWAE